MNFNKRKGLQYESLAREYLLKQGLKCLVQNYHSRFGEIDLIMHDMDMVYFIEVKFRKDLDFGGAASSITRQKQQKIIKTAQVFMQNNRKLSHSGMRFDALILQQLSDKVTIEWLQNAFYAESYHD